MDRARCALLLGAILATATAVPSLDGLVAYSFTDFTRDYRRTYSDSEVDVRRAQFEANKKTILAHNAGNHSWTMTLNHFADMSAAEIKATSRGVSKRALHAVFNGMRRTGGPEREGQLPSAWDWRDTGVITPVKDQGRCGSCWAFAATETLESYLALATNRSNTTLSVQQMVSCTQNPQDCGGTGGCSGATAELGWDYVVHSAGVASDASWPYTSGTTGKNGDCFNGTNVTTVAKFDGFVKLPENNLTAVMDALATVGPLAVVVDAGTWGFYAGGVMQPTTYTILDLDHGVQLVGYGTENGVDYWMIRNSWGARWGEQGYIRIRRNPAAPEYCGQDVTPKDGTGCSGGPPTITACDSFGVLYDTAYPTGAMPVVRR
jgi:cathepsin L